MNEFEFIDQLKALAIHPASRGLADDAAVLPFGRHKLVMTHDMMVEGVHFLPTADPADVAWKLVVMSLSDLAAKGAKPLGMLMGYSHCADSEWSAAFLRGLKEVIAQFSVPLLGGDTVKPARGVAASFGLTAFGEAKGHIVPSRDGAKPGHAIYVTGEIGDAWGGLQIASGEIDLPDGENRTHLLKAHNRPIPMLEEGRAISSLVSAMMDISDGLLLDAKRIADASGVAIKINLSDIPLSRAYKAVFGNDEKSRKQAATGGDDYQLLLMASPETVLPIPVIRIGTCETGNGISLLQDGELVSTPEQLGFVHI